MNIFETEPMVKDINQVHTTTDYFLFKPIEGNRNKNLLHINRLKKSMAETYLFTVIIVNEKYEIIDGQHRFDVIQELKLPLNYIVCKGYGLNEVHILNQNSKTWTSDDYLDGYCKLGYKDYLKYKEFKELYGIGHYECMWLLNGSQLSNPTQVFFTGDFKIKNYNEACKIIEKIMLVEPYYEEWKRRSFILAMLQLFKNPNFELTEFLQKLKLQPTALSNCSTTNQYVSLIEEIYNYRRREKVNLRY
ncbi:MAG: hypothetical protein IPG21_04930 [Saprospiraceae bacterium]|nr:hypothetical protein [Candidatus Vicinibacter affinis]MBK7695506.1 hypothetical protein [Candidatus Vicinibacter affinis]